MAKLSLTIGSDPELVWYFRPLGTIIAPVQIAKRFGFTPNKMNGEVGADGGSGNSKIAELRPRYGNTPQEHLKSIDGIIKMLYQNVYVKSKGFISLSAACETMAVGGHIHFGSSEFKKVDPGSLRPLKIEKCADNLDYWLAPLLAPLWNQESMAQRLTHGDYGRLGEWRDNTHGFEYRTLPSWIANRDLTSAVLTLAYEIVYRTLEDKLQVRSSAKDKRWAKRMTYAFLLKDADTEEFRQKRLESLQTLVKGSKEVGQAVDTITQFLETGLPNHDVFQGWGHKKIELPKELLKESRNFLSSYGWTLEEATEIYFEDHIKSNKPKMVELLTSRTAVSSEVSGEEIVEKVIDEWVEEVFQNAKVHQKTKLKTVRDNLKKVLADIPDGQEILDYFIDTFPVSDPDRFDRGMTRLALRRKVFKDSYLIEKLTKLIVAEVKNDGKKPSLDRAGSRIDSMAGFVSSGGIDFFRDPGLTLTYQHQPGTPTPNISTWRAVTTDAYQGGNDPRPIAEDRILTNQEIRERSSRVIQEAAQGLTNNSEPTSPRQLSHDQITEIERAERSRLADQISTEEFEQIRQRIFGERI